MPIVISGRGLADLLRKDGWSEGRRTRHGIVFKKQFPGERAPRYTIVSDKPGGLKRKTLGAILSVSQTGLGFQGLQELIDRYGR